MRRLVLLLVTLLPLLATGAARAAGPEVLPMPVGVRADYQIGGVRDVPDDVGIVVRDRRAEPAGVYDVCYVNAFQTQPDEQGFWKRHPRLVLRRHGRPVVDGAWGEQLLDLRTASKRAALARVVAGWTAQCARDGYEAVELDNLDSFTRSRGLLTGAMATAYARLLVRDAHAVGLAVAQKNRAGWDGTTVGFDLAVAEECGRYRECGAYAEDYGRRVVVVEYRATDLTWTCAHHGDLAVVLRDRDVTPEGVRRWCPAA